MYMGILISAHSWTFSRTTIIIIFFYHQRHRNSSLINLHHHQTSSIWWNPFLMACPQVPYAHTWGKSRTRCTFFTHKGLVSFTLAYQNYEIADLLALLVHRDVKDENVVLGPGGRCILIDFGSSGLIKKNGWDTFSGTQVYFST